LSGDAPLLAVVVTKPPTAALLSLVDAICGKRDSGKDSEVTALRGGHLPLGAPCRVSVGIAIAADSESMMHTVTNLVVDIEAGTVATEQHVDLVAGGTTEMRNCNFFTVNDDGQFSRVIIWMDGVNPLT
jgi:hypothetical protein